jgi:hypothetical protein
MNRRARISLGLIGAAIAVAALALLLFSRAPNPRQSVTLTIPPSELRAP